jgi:hypothetical protein
MSEKTLDTLADVVLAAFLGFVGAVLLMNWFSCTANFC